MRSLLSRITARRNSPAEILSIATDIRSHLLFFSKIEDINANRSFLDRMSKVRQFLPISEKDVEKRSEEVNDVLFSSYSLITEMKNYLHDLRNKRELLLAESDREVFS